jgi:uncharacterized membrane protein
VSTETKTTLYEHIKHLHTPRNVNAVHADEQQGINAKVAVTLTHVVGSMQTAYIFIVIALIGLLAILGLLSPIVALLVAWTSQTLIQLVLLPVIMVGQNVLSRHSELQADEAFQTTQRSYNDIEQVMSHLDAQDAKILEILEHLNTQQTRPVRAVKKKTEEQS